MHNYPSDITREQFELIRTEFESAKKATRPQKVDLYDVFCAVLYIIKGGIQWRMLPSDFPNWKLVYYYFTVWSAKSEDGSTLLAEVLKKVILISNKKHFKNRRIFAVLKTEQGVLTQAC